MRPCWHSIPVAYLWVARLQTIWLVGRHSDPFTFDNTVLCCVTVAPLGMFLLAYLFDMYPLIFESHAAWSQFLGICFVIGLRYYWVCHLEKICNIFFYCPHRCEKCYTSTGMHSISCFSHSFQSARSGCTHEHFFCVNACLCCTSVSSPMPAIYSCRAIRRHFLRLSDCLSSFTLLFLTLPFFLMVHASTLSAILSSAAAAGNLISVSSSSSAHESSDLNSSATDAWLVANLPFLQLLRVHLLVLRICLVLWCGLLSFRGGRPRPSTREKFRQYKFSHSSCQVLVCLCSMRLVESIAEHISFSLLSYSCIRCARPLLRHMRFMVTSVLRRSFNSRKKGTVHLCASSRSERFQISSLKIVYSLLWWKISITQYRAFYWAEAFSDSSARYMSILFQSNRIYSKSVRARDVRIIWCTWHVALLL